MTTSIQNQHHHKNDGVTVVDVNTQAKDNSEAIKIIELLLLRELEQVQNVTQKDQRQQQEKNDAAHHSAGHSTGKGGTETGVVVAGGAASAGAGGAGGGK